jgi:hypothetical protein
MGRRFRRPALPRLCARDDVLSLSKSAQRLGRGRLGGGGGGGGGVLSSSKSVHFTGGVQGLYACATGGEEAPATPRVWRGSLTIPSVARACSLTTVAWRARGTPLNLFQLLSRCTCGLPI